MIFKAILLALSASLCAAIINSPNIHRPCQLKDIRCIQNSLRSRSRCTPAKGFAPPVYKVSQARFDTPAFNASYVDNDLLIKGLDRCFVSEYYLNRATNGGVLAIDCPWLTFDSKRVMYQHYPRREDKVFKFSISGNYPLTILTTQLTNINNINLCKEFTSAHVNALPTFNLSPEDRQTNNHLTRDLSALGTYEQETFAARAQLLARVFVNTKLCNFGCV